MAAQQPLIDKKAILATIDSLEKQLAILSPEINRAQLAGFDVADQLARYNELKNALAKAKAAYSA